jgi:tellurium resistance protein TerZ
MLRRADTKGLPEDFELLKGRYGFGVSWENIGGKEVDIDLQCVVVDQAGAIIDCAYYNNLKAAKGITHSGDEVAGKPQNIDEMVWVNFPRLASNVEVLVFVVAAYAGGALRDVQNGTLHVFEEREANEIASFEMERSAHSVDVVAAMFRVPGGGWRLRVIDVDAQKGQHFMDILPLLSETIRVFIPSAPKKQKVAFAMEKGGVLDLPQEMNKITIGLGWDVDDGECDLDVSAVLLDGNGRDLEAVFFGRLESDEHGIVHSGDNLTGEGDGDDEQIVVDLNSIGPVVQQVFFVVNIYSQGVTFSQVASPYCRVVDNSTGSELCRYALKDAGHENGLIVSRIAREAGNRWGFHALGQPCRGRTYKDSIPAIRHLANVKTHALLQRSGTSMSDIGGPSGQIGKSLVVAPTAPQYSQVYPMAPIAPPQKECCTTQ